MVLDVIGKSRFRPKSFLDLPKGGTKRVWTTCQFLQLPRHWLPNYKQQVLACGTKGKSRQRAVLILVLAQKAQVAKY